MSIERGLWHWLATAIAVLCPTTAAAISFERPITYDQPAPVALHGVSGTPLIAADWDGDGRLDLAVITETGFSLLYGNGDGTLAAPVDYPVGGRLQEGTAADVNGDGRLDLAICHFSLGKLLVLINQGGRRFAPPINYPVASEPVGVTAADFNADQAVDLAVSCPGSGNVSLLLNRGDGTFRPAEFIGGIGSPGGVISADFNGDGRVDLAQTSLTENVVRILLGDGAGKFTVSGRFRTEEDYANRVVTEDFNGDGILDLAVASLGNYSILFGDGAGGFGRPTRYHGFHLIDVADFDGDGDLDLVTPGGDTSGFSVHENGEAGNFMAPMAVSVLGEKTSGVRAGDFNGDGRPDVVAWVEGTTRLAVFLNNTSRPTPALRSLALTPATVIGGCEAVEGVVTLTAPAPPGGMSVTLSSSNAAVTVPADIAIPEGSTSARFAVTVSAVTSIQFGSIAAGIPGSGRRASLTVRPGGTAGVRLTPSSVIGGQPVTGEVTLPCPAGAGGVTVALSSSDGSAARVAETVVVPAGAFSATFPVETRPVTTNTPVVITARFDGLTRTAILEVRPVPPPPPPPPPVNLLVNGSFELPDTSESPFGWLWFGAAGLPGRPAAAAAIPGWKIPHGTVDVKSWYWPAKEGKQSLDLVGDNPGSIEQSFATTPGQEYVFSGWIAHHPANVYLPEGRANVFLNRAFFLQLLHREPGATLGDMRWQPFSARFRATGTMTTLLITDATGSPFPGGLVLDGLAVTPATATTTPAQ